MVQLESDEGRWFMAEKKANKSFLMEESAKLLAMQPGNMWAKRLRKYFIFIYVGYEINIA